MGGNVLLESFLGRGGGATGCESVCVSARVLLSGTDSFTGSDTALCEKRVKKSKCQEFVYLNKSDKQLSDAYTHTHKEKKKQREIE